VIRKKLFIKGNKLIKRTFRLFILFVTVSITGLVPWLFGFSFEARHHIIEIHDKIAIIMSILFLYHFAIRHNWLVEYIQKNKSRTKVSESISQG
jgi:hypothetical protein